MLQLHHLSCGHASAPRPTPQQPGSSLHSLTLSGYTTGSLSTPVETPESAPHHPSFLHLHLVPIPEFLSVFKFSVPRLLPSLWTSGLCLQYLPPPSCESVPSPLFMPSPPPSLPLSCSSVNWAMPSILPTHRTRILDLGSSASSELWVVTARHSPSSR